MSSTLVHEPNPVPPRPLGPMYFRQFADFLLSSGAHGRIAGLLPPTNGTRSPLPALDLPSTLRLESIRAIGERGFPIVMEPTDPPLLLDAAELGIGVHVVYAALFQEREEVGEMAEFFTPDGLNSTRVQVDIRHRIELVAGDRRFDAWDWLPVARVLREREGGAVQTFLDTKFHPPIIDLRAIGRSNPIGRLVERGIRALDEIPAGAHRDLARIELQVLGNLAEAADPATAFLQTQRCLQILHLVPELRFKPGKGLLGMSFARERFGEYLALLGEAIEGGEATSKYPALIEVDGLTYQRLGGEFTWAQGTWTWGAPPSCRAMNGLVVYFPDRSAGDIPLLKCSKVNTGAERFENAQRGERVSATGAAILLPCANGSVEHVFAMPLLVADELPLGRQMEMGHGLYYR